MTHISEIIAKFNSISIPVYLLYELNGETADLILDWIKYRKNNQICDELKYPGWQTNKNISKNKISMIRVRPDESVISRKLPHSNWKIDKDGKTPLMFWIIFRNNESIPEELKYTGWQTDKSAHDCDSIMMLWIEFRTNEPIPEYLKYPGWITYLDGLNGTPVIHWIKFRNNEPIPDELKYPGWKTDYWYHDETPLMIWIKFRNTEPIPDELKYRGWETDIRDRDELSAWDWDLRTRIKLMNQFATS